MKETCTSSHIWLKPSDGRMEIVTLDKSECSSTYKNQTIIDRYCMVIGPREKERNRLFRVHRRG